MKTPQKSIVALLYCESESFPLLVERINALMFTSLLCVIILFSRVQLLAFGIIGEYVLRFFFNLKKRPLFLIKEEIVNREYI